MLFVTHKRSIKPANIVGSLSNPSQWFYIKMNKVILVTDPGTFWYFTAMLMLHVSMFLVYFRSPWDIRVALDTLAAHGFSLLHSHRPEKSQVVCVNKGPPTYFTVLLMLM